MYSFPFAHSQSLQKHWKFVYTDMFAEDLSNLIWGILPKSTIITTYHDHPLSCDTSSTVPLKKKTPLPSPPCVPFSLHLFTQDPEFLECP